MPIDWDPEKWQRQKQRGPEFRAQDIGNFFKRFKGRFPGIWLLIAIFLAIYMATSMFYTVEVDEVGVVQRFGKFVRITHPGLNIKLPFGIEKVTKVKVRRIFKEEFGFRTLKAGIKTRYAPDKKYQDEYLMLTGDLNVGVVQWAVHYRISDPYKYLFKVRDVRGTLRDISEAVMRLVVGDRSINEVISRRAEIALEAKTLLQEELNRAECGITITTIEMKNTSVPKPVQPSFNEVNQAIQEKEKMIYEAKEKYNKVIPAARGEAEKTIRRAEGYALERINKARGDASRFKALYQEYVKAKDITKRRLYLEAIEKVFSNIKKKYIVDENQKNLLPFLKLNSGEKEKLR